MVTGTKNSIDTLLNNTSKNLSSKATSETYKADNNKGISKSETSKSEDFKEVLNSKANSKDVDTEKVDEVNKNESSTETQDVDKVTELKEKLKELDEESKSASKDEVTDILNELLVLLAKLGIKKEDLKSNGETSPDILKTMINKINGDGSSKNNLSNIMGKIIELLKTDSVKDGLDTNSLKLMENL